MNHLKGLKLEWSLCVLCVFFQTLSLFALPVSSLVVPGPDGSLSYVGYANEDQTNADNIMIDFSQAGYQGGGVAIPWVPVVIALDPVASGDDYARIQQAIDDVAAMPLSSAGFRGAILLKNGDYRVSQTLKIQADGIVIRGEGQWAGGTVVTFTATQQDNLFEFTGSGGWASIGGTTSAITNTFVGSGAHQIDVASAAGYSVGDRIIVRRTPNQAWIDLIKMGQYGWTPSAYNTQSPRTITAIDGNRITLDAPLIHAIESQYGGGDVFRYHFNNGLHNVGIERMRLASSYTSNTDEDHGWAAVQFSRVENAWVRRITAQFFGNNCVSVINQSQKVTVEDCSMLDAKSENTGGRRYSFNLDGACFTLVQRCYTREGRHDYVTGSLTAGPNVFVDCVAKNTYANSGPHHRYAQGLLFDNVSAGQIDVENRRDSGTGHGWSGAQTVFWSCNVSGGFICDAPKAAMNFCIGSVGNKHDGTWAPSEPDGFWELRQTNITPRSLYYRQLQDRLGAHAMQLVTTSGQRNGRVWDAIASWKGYSNPPDSVVFSPVQVEVLPETASTRIGDALTLNALVRFPLPENFSASGAWTVDSGPGEVVFESPSEVISRVWFRQPGVYALRYTHTQTDDSDPLNPVDYTDFDTVMVEVVDHGALTQPPAFPDLGEITAATAALTIDTDALTCSGGINASGRLGVNPDGSEVAVFVFSSINMVNAPTLTGSRPLVLVAEGDLSLDSTLNVAGGSGSHKVGGSGVAGGGDGGHANRDDSPGRPYDGQGPGGSSGNETGEDDSSSAGGSFGGRAGGSSTPAGWPYGSETLHNLIGGSGAGGTRNKGGGAGGGAVALIAGGNLQLTTNAVLNADGGGGSASGSQLTSGGGSGGAILLSGKNVLLQGTISARGGNGGDASGGQKNGGGGGGGRIAIYYRTTLDSGSAAISVDGGIPLGSNSAGDAGGVGTIYTSLTAAGLADQWLYTEVGVSDPDDVDWASDYDGDGLSAWAEYQLGGSEQQASPAVRPRIQRDSNGEIRYVFNRRREGADWSAYALEESTTLMPGSWSRVYPDESMTREHPSLPGFDEVTVPIADDFPRWFIRMHLR
ncbi:MAG: hypothetical protein H7A51_18750 [Akkermansiaceae bacterium]|nr:hypothetical protein [Akkermansiaceae bacterium]